MKVTHQLSRLEPIVLNPLHGVSDEHWRRPRDGQWSLAQIVEHLAISIDVVAAGFEDCADGECRQRHATPEQALMRHVLLGAGEFPKGMRAPDYTLPSDDPNPELAQANFRMAIERTRALVEDWPEEKQISRFLRHPAIGDLNLPEWVRFHYVHCSLHARQINKWLKWLRGEH
jgi:hypothetical protein